VVVASTPGPLSIAAPDIAGPRVRVGVLWFLLALAAATSGRWWTAALWSLIAFAAGVQTVLAWHRPAVDAPVKDSSTADDAAQPAARAAARVTAPPGVIAAALLAGSGAAAVTGAAAYSTGLAGVLLTGLAAALGVALLAAGRARRRAVVPAVVATLLPAIAASSVVLAVRVDLWAGLFLILAVSLYDAGAFLFGAEAAGRWEGPVGGLMGALAVTFTMSTVDVPPFDRVGSWIAGAAVAASCVLGQALVTGYLPARAPHVGALRRLDAYVLAGPVFVACAWALGS
jgi:hypothetical protein